jgi:hypothetical protein
MKLKRIILALILSTFLSIESRADVIVNSESKIQQLSSSDLYAIFSFDKKFYEGEKVVVILPPVDSVSFNSLALRLNRSNSSYVDMVRAKELAGVASPIYATSDSNVVIKVSLIPNSIGFYYDKMVVNTSIGVRIITIK